jgi:hypothetical protein
LANHCFISGKARILALVNGCGAAGRPVFVASDKKARILVAGSSVEVLKLVCKVAGPES